MYSILILATRIFLHKYIVTGVENVDNGHSAVFVCNHAQAYGPVAMVIFFPFKFRPWVLYTSMTRGLCRKQLEKDLFGDFPRILKPVGRFLSLLVEPACLWVMRKVNAICVYRGRPEIFRTFNESTKALTNGCNIVLFPENTDMKQTFELQGFYSGFVHLAREYGEATGKNLMFYPVYINRKLRNINIGKPVIYNPDTNFEEERLRVKDELEHSMRMLAGNDIIKS